MMKSFGRTTILTLAALAAGSLAWPSPSLARYYECEVRVSMEKIRTETERCFPYRGNAHRCQLYGLDAAGQEVVRSGGVPDACDDCLRESEIPEDCAEVVAQRSSNPEAHERRGDAGAGAAVPDVLFDRLPTDADIPDDAKEQAGVLWDKVKEKTKDALVCEKRTAGYLLEFDGNPTIHRGFRSLPPRKGMTLEPGDILGVSDGGTMEVNLLNDEGPLTIYGPNKFQLPRQDLCAEEEPGLVTKIRHTVSRTLGKWWLQFTSLLKGESFEIEPYSTGAVGVRG